MPSHTRTTRTSEVHRYTRKIGGPDLSAPFTVMAGAVVIGGVETGYLIPAGGTWPGRDAIDPELDLLTMASESYELSGDTEVTWHTTPAAIEAGIALITAQALRARVNMHARLSYLLGTLPGQAANDEVLAFALGLTREHVTKVRSEIKLAAGKADTEKAAC